MRRLRSDSGAVAVEFALVLFPLLLILMGIIDFGHVYTQQLSLTAAAREGVRVVALADGSDPLKTGLVAETIREAARRSIREASPALTPQLIDPIAIPAVCVPGQPGQPPVSVTVTLTYPLTSITGMFESMFAKAHLTGEAVMRCGG